MGKCTVGVYTGSSLNTKDMIMDGRSSYIPNKVYKNENYNIFWFINKRGYIHILRPCTVNPKKHLLFYAVEDWMLTKNDTLKSNGFSGRYNSIEEVNAFLENMVLKKEEN